ncbi:hypothetical protein KCU62_g5650, partial [Aureobasidium sp. EXF-3399]
MEKTNPWDSQGVPAITHTQQALPSSSLRIDRSLTASEKRLKKQTQPRQLLSCNKCRERKVKCDRTKPCSACCARGLPKECQFVLGEGAEFGPIQQSLELRRLRAENQRLKERLLADKSSASEESDTEEGSANVRLSSAAKQSKRQRRFRANEQIDSIYFGSPGLASVIADFANLQVQPKSLSHAMPRAADMYTTQDAMYPFPTLWPAMSRTQGFAFPYVPEDLSQKEVERFLENAGENADKVPDLLALIFAASALGVQLTMFEDRQEAGAGVSQNSSRKGEIFSVAAMQALRLASFTSRPSLRGIKVLIMLAPYLTNSGRFLDAWSFSGLTIRLAHSIGLHRNPRFLDPAPSLRETTVRKHLWWWLLHMDQEYSMTLGRPLGISGIGDCPPPEPLTTDPVALRLSEFFDQLTIQGRQILSSNQLTDSKIDMYTDRLIALWDTMPESLQFNRSWIEETTQIPEWPMETRAAISYCSIHNYIILLNRQRIENNRNSPDYRPSAPDYFLEPSLHTPSPSPLMPRGRPLVIESCLALLDAFQFFHKRVPSALVDWTIGQQAFNACMILVLDGIDRESVEHIERVEKAHTIFVKMDKAGMHQLTELAMSRIAEGLRTLRHQSETRKPSMAAEPISPMDVAPNHQRASDNPFDWGMGQQLHNHDFLHEPVMGATGMFLLEDHGLQTRAYQPKIPPSPGNLPTPDIAVIPSPSSKQPSFEAGLMLPSTTLLEPRRDSAHPLGFVPNNHPAPLMPAQPVHYNQVASPHFTEMQQPIQTWNQAEAWQTNVLPAQQRLYSLPVAPGGGLRESMSNRKQSHQ